MPNFSVYLGTEEVLAEIDTDDLREELRKRESKERKATAAVPSIVLFDRVYWHFRRTQEAPECLRDLLWQEIGRSL